MAITCTVHTADGSATDATSYDTASVTLTSGTLYYLCVENSFAGTPNLPTCSGWASVVTVVSAYPRLTIFKKIGDGSTGAHTIDFAAQTQRECQWAMLEWGTDVNESTPEVQTKTATGTSANPGVTFDSAFGDAVNNATLLVIDHQWNVAQTPDGSLIELRESIVGDTRWNISWMVGEDASPSVTCASSKVWGAIGVEVAAAAGGLSIPAAMMHNEG